MSLYGALYSGVSGLKSQSNKLGIISDNIANANTVGYKAGQAQFETLVTNSNIATAYSPGGVESLNRQLVDKQGLLQTTDSPTDIAISGAGFFAVSPDTDPAGQVLYTRAGSFRQDSLGNFQNASGFYLLGWPLDRNGLLPGEPGNIDTTPSNNLTSLQVVNVQSVAGVAAATTKVSIGANLKSTESIYPGAGATMAMDSLDPSNFGISANSIIVPGGADGIQRGDKFTTMSGSGVTDTFRYGGFTFGRDITTSAVGDNGLALAPTTVVATSFDTAASGATSTTVTVQVPATTGMNNGDVVQLGAVRAGVYDGIADTDLNGQSFVISNVTATSFDISVPVIGAAGVAGAEAAAFNVNVRPFVGNVLDATSPTTLFLGTTGTSGFTTAGLTFTIATPTTGTVTFTYTSAAPNAQLGQFNTLNNLVTAINNVNGLTARVVNNRLFVGTADANESITFGNGSTQGVSGPPVQAGIDWVTELGLANQASGNDRFNSMQSLADLANAKTDLSASITDPTGASKLKINLKDPLDTITFADPPIVVAPVALGATPFTTVIGSNVVTVDTSPANHGLQTGDRVQINGVPVGAYNGFADTDFNGQNFLITVTGPTTFTITIPGVTATASGATGAAGSDYTGHNNIGSLLGALGLGASLNGGPYVPETDGALGPQYDPTNAAKNMTSGAITAQFSRTIQIYDAQGTSHDLNVSFIKTAINTWAVEVSAVPATDVSGGTGQVAYGTVTFNGDGSLSTVSSSLTSPITMNWTDGAAASKVAFNWGTAGQPFGTVGATTIGKTDGLSQFDSNYNVVFANQNGAQVGKLIGVSIDADGIVSANYDNGQTQNLFKIPMAAFTNPNQLQSETGNVYAETALSGTVNLREAGTNGVGKIAPASLESSNVDLAEQLTDMIVAQRAYEANSKVITVSDQLLDDLNRAVT